MNEYDYANIGRILNGEGNWFNAHLLRFLNTALFKADSENRRILHLNYTEGCIAIYKAWDWEDKSIFMEMTKSGLSFDDIERGFGRVK